jgi:hypothetical protein
MGALLIEAFIEKASFEKASFSPGNQIEYEARYMA